MQFRTLRSLRALVLTSIALTLFGLCSHPFLTNAATLNTGSTYFVSPNGSDSNDGHSEGGAFKSIQKGLDVAQPGDTVNLLAGNYSQDVVSVRNGTADAPITISGPASAVVSGGGNARIFEVNHDYLVLNGFTIDGQNGASYRDKLLYVHGIDARDGVTGLVVRNMTLKNAGGECMRLRYFVQKAQIDHNTIGPCGRDDFPNGVWAGGTKNGEGIYVGTAPEQRGDGKNPTSDPDESNENWIHNNIFNTQGNECVDIKEAATRNLVEYNNCTGQKDENSAGFDARGSGNVFRYNESYGNLGSGFRLGGDTSADGIHNDIYGNIIRDNKQGGIKFQIAPQGTICGNTMSGNSGGDAVGSAGDSFVPTQDCDASVLVGQPTPTQPTPTPDPTQPPAGTWNVYLPTIKR